MNLNSPFTEYGIPGVNLQLTSLEEKKERMAECFESITIILPEVVFDFLKNECVVFERELKEQRREWEILDLGCGRSGIYADLFIKRKWNAVAIDLNNIFSPAKIFTNEWPCASRYQAEGKLTFIQNNITTYRFDEEHGLNRYPMVTCMDVLPYISFKDYRSLLSKIFRATAPGGFFLGNFALCEGESPLALKLWLSEVTVIRGRRDRIGDYLNQFGFQLKKIESDKLDEACFHVNFIAQKP